MAPQVRSGRWYEEKEPEDGGWRDPRDLGAPGAYRERHWAVPDSPWELKRFWRAPAWAEDVRGAVQGFGGRSVHAVQIGLGTFSTLVQNLAGGPEERDPMVTWYMEALSETRPEHFRCVAVEPVAEHLDRLSALAEKLPHVRLVQVAVGEREAKGAEIHVLTGAAHDALLKSVRSPRQRRELQGDLLYLRNMSSIGVRHPCWDYYCKRAWKRYGVDIRAERLPTDVWSYDRLARHLDFRGCELLFIDAEGHDTEILRSMIRHCSEQEKQGVATWPDLIVFEAAGLCDHKEGFAAEQATIKQLERHGYSVFLTSRTNVNLVRLEAVPKSPRLSSWVGRLFCYTCRDSSNRAWPLTFTAGQLQCPSCHRIG